MKNYLTVLIICGTIAAVLFSCKKHTMEPNHTSRAIIDYFPNEIGSQWKYIRFDSLANLRDTITVTIVNQTTINGKPMKIWQYGASSDTITTKPTYDVGIQHDTLWFDFPYSQCYEGFRIPFVSGSIGHYSGDSIFISGWDSLTVPARTFDSTKQIYLQCWCGDECSSTSRVWFAPHIGFVKISINSYDWPPPHYRKEEWRLLSYHLIPRK